MDLRRFATGVVLLLMGCQAAPGRDAEPSRANVGAAAPGRSQASPKTPVNTNIKTIELEHGNASTGPHENKVSFTIRTKDFPENVQRLLDETTVNGAASLRVYLAFLEKEDAAGAEKVRESFHPGPLPTGGTTSSLTMELEDGRRLTFSDLRQWQLRGYYNTDFEKLLEDRGSKYESVSPQHAEPRVLPRLTAPSTTHSKPGPPSTSRQ